MYSRLQYSQMYGTVYFDLKALVWLSWLKQGFPECILDEGRKFLKVTLFRNKFFPYEKWKIEFLSEKCIFLDFNTLILQCPSPTLL